jgi:Gas vesicle synthesis protein GvpO
MSEQQARPDGRGDGGNGGRAPDRRSDVGKVAVRAIEQLADLLGTPPDRVIGVEPRDSGWRVRLEVVELERIPETTSILASYDVEVDGDGELIAYRRTGRYARGQIEGGYG